MLLACVGAVSCVVFMTCGQRQTIGLPLAYLIALALIHLPGGLAYAASEGEYTGLLTGGDYPAVGLGLTAVGMWSFVFGLFLVRTSRMVAPPQRAPERAAGREFILFCVVAGWIAAFGATPLTAIPTLGAAIVFGSSIWMLGVILGLGQALKRASGSSTAIWLSVLMVYPVTTLAFGGFLSYGSSAIAIVLSSALARLRRIGLALIVLPFGLFLGISVFVNYYDDRDALRDVVWSGAGVDERLDAVARTFSGFRLFDINDPGHLEALSARLNQNEFVGVAYDRLENGEVEYLRGRSFLEGVISIVPRAIWPDKPVYGGSPAVVSEMTGLSLSQTTSWGVGNVMEFYINFGFWSLIPAFILLGVLIGWLDIKTARALSGNYHENALYYFLPAVALIQPNGSMVELTGGAFAALLAAYFWVWAWRTFSRSARTVPVVDSDSTRSRQ